MGIITFNGVSSNSFGIEVSSPPRYVIPEEDVAQVHIPGVNGDKLRRYRSFKNIQIQYAITFLAPEYQYGDANLDRVVSPADASALLRYLSGNYPEMQFSDLQKMLSDVDHDGSLTVFDAFFILHGLVHSTSFASNSVGYLSSFIASWLHPCYTSEELDIKEAEDMVSGVFHANKDGYIKLYDTYDPDFYRKALCKNAMDIVNVYGQGGATNIVFDAMPQKFFFSGESWLSSPPGPSYDQTGYAYTEAISGNHDIKNTFLLINPSRFLSLPLIRIHQHQDFPIIVPDTWEATINISNVPYEAVSPFDSAQPTINLDSVYITNKTIRFKPYYGSRSTNGDMYIDFQNGNAYTVATSSLRPARIDINDHILTRISSVAGLLTPGFNIIGVKVTRPNADPIYPSFEVLPRWWTL